MFIGYCWTWLHILCCYDLSLFVSLFVCCATEASSSSLAAILSAIVVSAVGAIAGYFTYQQKKLCFKNRQGNYLILLLLVENELIIINQRENSIYTVATLTAVRKVWYLTRQEILLDPHQQWMKCMPKLCLLFSLVPTLATEELLMSKLFEMNANPHQSFRSVKL